jgi:hypothetical protein
MPASHARAEFSIYRSSTPYRLHAGGLSTVRSAVSDCVDRCMAKCVADAVTCRIECRAECSPSVNCPPGQQTCWGISPHHRCCPAETSCCVYHERPSLRTIIACCAPGEQCCMYGGCYDPSSQQCLPSGISNCPPGREPCGTTCCPPGEVCTLDGCTPVGDACLGRRCEPGQTCTPQGCCARDRAASNGCCPFERVICDGKCCAPGEICRQKPGFGGFCVPGVQ